MNTLESLVSDLMAGAPFRAAFAADPEAALAARDPTLTDTEHELVERLRPLLTLPAGVLLQRLLDDGLDGPQRWWNALVFPAQPVP